jgi:hypothetical protein
MRIPTIVIGIGAIIVIAAIVWMVRNNKKEAFILQRNGKCPRGTRVEYLTRRGKKMAVCVGNPGGNALDKYVAKNFPYWGWGPNAGMKCKNPNNTGCDTTFGYAKK